MLRRKNAPQAVGWCALKGFLSTLCIVLLLSGCGGMAGGLLAGALLGGSLGARKPEVSPVRIVLAPQLPAPTAKIGSGEKLSLMVIDKRNKEDLLGYYWQAVEAEIRASNSLGTVTRESLRKGLSDLGFEVLESPMTSVPSLEITIQNFKYWVARDVNADAQLDAVLYGGDGWVAKKSYTINNRFDKPNFLRDAGWIEEKINASISDLILKILTDPELLVGLKEKVVGGEKRDINGLIIE